MLTLARVVATPYYMPFHHSVFTISCHVRGQNWDPDEEDDLEDDLFADDEDIPDKQLVERDEMTRQEILEV